VADSARFPRELEPWLTQRDFRAKLDGGESIEASSQEISITKDGLGVEPGSHRRECAVHYVTFGLLDESTEAIRRPRWNDVEHEEILEEPVVARRSFGVDISGAVHRCVLRHPGIVKSHDGEAPTKLDRVLCAVDKRGVTGHDVVDVTFQPRNARLITSLAIDNLWKTSPNGACDAVVDHLRLGRNTEIVSARSGEAR
jgi:hypothetical protein